MNAIQQLFAKKRKNLLSIYFTAGYPKLDSTQALLESLQKAEVDLIEISMPYSDPLADGPTIQKSSQKALEHGMTISRLFTQLKELKGVIDIPLILMGYYNQFLCFGQERLLQACVDVGISGLILPDLPPEIYQAQYRTLFESYGLLLIFLATPQTSDQRIRMLSEMSQGFLYLVSSTSTTGARETFGTEQIIFFERVKALDLKIPKLIGFGISNKVTFELACRYADGVIIGSAFINVLDKNRLEKSVENFIISIR
ncbi:MAG: tryptophan synthase subunit alpha [Flavobacteriales bacterium AspAUS03]